MGWLGEPARRIAVAAGEVGDAARRFIDAAVESSDPAPEDAEAVLEETDPPNQTDEPAWRQAEARCRLRAAARLQLVKAPELVIARRRSAFFGRQPGDPRGEDETSPRRCRSPRPPFVV